jgi:hypothetical protein
MQHHLITAALFLILSVIRFLGSGWGGESQLVDVWNHHIWHSSILSCGIFLKVLCTCALGKHLTYMNSNNILLQLLKQQLQRCWGVHGLKPVIGWIFVMPWIESIANLLAETFKLAFISVFCFSQYTERFRKHSLLKSQSDFLDTM